MKVLKYSGISLVLLIVIPAALMWSWEQLFDVWDATFMTRLTLGVPIVFLAILSISLGMGMILAVTNTVFKTDKIPKSKE